MFWKNSEKRSFELDVSTPRWGVNGQNGYPIARGISGSWRKPYGDAAHLMIDIESQQAVSS